MTDAATSLGAAKSRIGIQQDFVKSLMDAVDRGVGQLVDADMNEESTKLQALQVQQQLGVQALSIANSARARASCSSSSKRLHRLKADSAGRALQAWPRLVI